MDIGSLRLNSRDLTLCFGTLFQFSHLLSLNRWGCDFLTKDDVPDFANSQRGDIDTITFTEIL